jgi:hypothetical protein
LRTIAPVSGDGPRLIPRIASVVSSTLSSPVWPPQSQAPVAPPPDRRTPGRLVGGDHARAT